MSKNRSSSYSPRSGSSSRFGSSYKSNFSRGRSGGSSQARGRGNPSRWGNRRSGRRTQKIAHSMYVSKAIESQVTSIYTAEKPLLTLIYRQFYKKTLNRLGMKTLQKSKMRPFHTSNRVQIY
ncbi:MAG TPA: hypothetical protein ENN92_01115 [candidate division WWE3 bacterium]|uniref:Uncharacterized protein n=1 Tax=candidate division WWE3 bacterium TaxID=2053526 RepID=A0A7C1DIH2_UNCKA|nr:hypothetical protein [candidate division WWE3 bacterium]